MVQSSSKLFKMGYVDIILISLYSGVSSIWFNNFTSGKTKKKYFKSKKLP